MDSEFNEKKLNALISLLDDPDLKVYENVSRQIYALGMKAIPFLDSAWMQTSDQIAMSRIEFLTHRLRYENILIELRKWRNQETPDLLKGIILISTYRFPEFDDKKITRLLGQIIQDVWLELNKDLTPLDKVKVINHILFGVYKFENNTEKPWTDTNIFINSLLESKKGNSISLSILYILVAQSLKIPVYGVDLPHHFILAYLNSMSFNNLSEVTDNDILFYINSSNKGLVFPAKDIEIYLNQSKIKQRDEYFLPCNNIAIIRQSLVYLEYVYKNSNDPEREMEIRRFISIIQGDEEENE